MRVRTAVLAVLLVACGSAEPGPPPPYPHPIAATPQPRPKRAKRATLEVPAPPPRAYGSVEELDRTVDAFLGGMGKEWGPGHAFHGYVLVRDCGDTVYAKAWGMANREKKSSLDGDTRFRVGSLTKMFTATAVLALEEERKLSTKDPLEKHLPDVPSAWRKVTLEQLLAQTSGIASYTSSEALMKKRGQKHTPAQVLAAVKDDKLAFEPGTKHQYSNTNYFLLGMIVEKVSGKPLASYLAERVLDRAGMKRTSLEDAPTLPNSAVGYKVDEQDQLVPADPIDFSVPFGAGALRSTPNDLARWHDALSGTKVLGEAAREKLFTPVHDGYAFGIARRAIGDARVQWHNGRIDGFGSFFAHVPSREGCVIVLTNAEDVDATRVGFAVLGAVIEGKKPEAPVERKVALAPPEFVNAAPGEYALTDASKKALEEKKAPAAVIQSVLGLTLRKPLGKAPKGVPTASLPALVMKPSGQDPLALFGGEGGVLFSKRAGVEVRGVVVRKKVTSVTLEQGGLALEYVPGKPKK